MTIASKKSLRGLLRDTTALAATEFALVFPILLSVGLMGMELANRAIIQMQLNQLAVHIADNASRIGDQSMLQDRRIYERDIQELFYGAELQAGEGLNLYGRGRVILSSLEVVPGTDEDQYIHWQRCMGTKNHPSSYGEEGDGLNNAFPGMGPAGEEVIAFNDEAVMFVELAYDYDPLIGNPYGFPTQIVSTASFTVRDDRDLSQIYQLNPDDPDEIADCETFGTTSFSDPLTATSSGSSSSTSSTSSTGSSTSGSSGGSTSTGSTSTSTSTGSTTSTSGGGTSTGSTTSTSTTSST